MGGEEAAAPAEAAQPMADQCVPAAALAVPDEGEQMAAPEVGDKVTYTVEGKVTRVEGEQVYVAPETINGEPVGKAAAPATDADAGAQPDPAYADIEQAAKAQGPL